MLKLKLNEYVGIRASKFLYSYVVGTHIIAYHAYLNFQNKNINHFSNVNTKFVGQTIFWFFVNKDIIMADDATMFLNPLVTLERDENFEETSFDMNVLNGRAKNN